MKYQRSILLLAMMAINSSLLAEDEQHENLYFGPNPVLTKQEKAAIKLARNWRSGSVAISPFNGQDGSVRYIYGAQHTSIVCAVLQVCDVQLQPGESVNSIHLGDTARWTVEPAITGQGAGQVQHLIIKPFDVGLKTSLIVTTDRRTYHFRLKSHRKDFMPNVSFAYPEDALRKWDFIKKHEQREKIRNTIPATGEYLGDLSFDYILHGSASWKPLRVYNDGVKTIIQMPRTMAQTEAPSLLVLREEEGIFSDEQLVMVNYRIQGDRYIVDAVFDRAILIAGVGGDQDRVTITRSKEL